MKWMYHHCRDNLRDDRHRTKRCAANCEVAKSARRSVVEIQRSSDGTIKRVIAVGDQRVETAPHPGGRPRYAVRLFTGRMRAGVQVLFNCAAGL